MSHKLTDSVIDTRWRTSFSNVNPTNVGVTGIDADNFIDGATLAAATAVGTYAQQAAAFQPIILQSADTLDVLIATSTTAISAGSIRVWAVVCSVSDRVGPASVDREQLA